MVKFTIVSSKAENMLFLEELISSTSLSEWCLASRHLKFTNSIDNSIIHGDKLLEFLKNYSIDQGVFISPYINTGLNGWTMNNYVNMSRIKYYRCGSSFVGSHLKLHEEISDYKIGENMSPSVRFNCVLAILTSTQFLTVTPECLVDFRGVAYSVKDLI